MMKLIALLCPTCTNPLPAKNEELVVLCTNCRAVVSLTDAGIQLQPITCIAPRPNVAVSTWLPFWVYTGQVILTKRMTQGGRSLEGEARQYWQERKRFFVPAWQLSMAQVKQIATVLIHDQPHYRQTEIPDSFSLDSVVFAAEDAPKLLDLIVVSVEAGRSDMMQDLDFQLRLDEPELWAIPQSEDKALQLVADSV